MFLKMLSVTDIAADNDLSMKSKTIFFLQKNMHPLWQIDAKQGIFSFMSPLRFHSVKGCQDLTHRCCDFGIDNQTQKLIVSKILLLSSHTRAYSEYISLDGGDGGGDVTVRWECCCVRETVELQFHLRTTIVYIQQHVYINLPPS